MEIVIDIPEEKYIRICDEPCTELGLAVRNGTPLPKGHGRIIDESQVTGTFTWDNGYIECYAPTIIEVDKESEGKEDIR